MADEPPSVRKAREPITVVFAVILLIACVLAIGIHINDNVLADNTTKVTSSSTVSVEYSGSLYDYYDKDGALFQTSISSIDENEDYKRIASYSKGSTLSVSMANPSVLAGFAAALLGHQAGDTVRVCIPAGEGYNAPETYSEMSITGCTVPNGMAYSSTDDLTAFGWSFTTSTDNATNSTVVSYDMESTDECTAEDTTFATVTTTGFTYSASNVMTYDMTITGATKEQVYNDDGTKSDLKYTTEQTGLTTEYYAVQQFTVIGSDGTAKTVIGAENIDDDGNITGKLLLKSTGAIVNQNLYFVIVINSIS